jgi:multiple antibiotic resistance protein
LALSAQAKSLATNERVPAFAGLFVCVAVLSVMVYFFCAYAPAAAKKFPAPIVHGVLRVIAFLLICIGAQIAWRGRTHCSWQREPEYKALLKATEGSRNME